MKKYYKLWGGLGLGITVVLWNLGAYMTMGCGGGYIDLGICPSYRYTWGPYSYISIVIFIISIFLIYKIRKEQNTEIKNKLGVYILVLSILGFATYYIYSHDTRVLYNFEYKNHLDKKGGVIDIDKYISYMQEYCLEDEYENYRIGGYGKTTMCKKRRAMALEKTEYYIKVFEYANKNDLKELYEYNYKQATKFGLEKVLEKYKDKTFMYYSGLDLYLSFKNDTTIINYLDKEVVDYYNNELINNGLLDKIKNSKPDTYDYRIKDIIKEKIKNNKEINHNIF